MPLASDQTITVDSTKVLLGGPDALGLAWPCALLVAEPPSVADRQSNPSAEDLLPAVLALTPRGPAWGTDEAGDGRGASKVMRYFWTAVAKWAADVNARDFAVATQALPSAVTTALPDWEAELGLPDTCLPTQTSIAARLAAVRVRFGSIGGSSPEYLRCLAASVGYDVVIEEPTQFLVDVSETTGPGLIETWFYADASAVDAGGIREIYALCDATEVGVTPLEDFAFLPARDGDRIEGWTSEPATAFGDEVAGGLVETWLVCDGGACDDDPIQGWDWDPNGTVWKFWTATVRTLGETWFRTDEGECAFDPIEGFLSAADLECVLRRACPPHTQLVFHYLAA